MNTTLRWWHDFLVLPPAKAIAKARMSTKPLSLIALVLFVPVAVLTFLAVHSFSLENDALSVRQERLAKQRKDAAASLILSRIQSLGTEVLTETRTAYATGGASALAKLVRKRVFAYAYVSRQGTQLYAATALEHQYDTARMMQDRAQELVASLTNLGPAAATLVPYAGGYTLLRCSRGSEGIDVCVAVDKTTLMRVLGSALAPVARSTGLQRIGLVDTNGNAIGLDAGETHRLTSQPLYGLLNGWRLRVEEAANSDAALQSTYFLYVIAGALIAGWLAMTWMLHRSSVLKEEASSVRANVVAQLAHDLRTPLANLKLHTDLLSRNAADASAVTRYGAVLDNEIDRLSLLAENAIAVARGAIAQPKLEVAIPDDCVRAIVERFEPTLSDAGCRVALNLNAAAPSHFDKTSWESCIVNLIDNARKYAAGATITLLSHQTPELLRLEVRDNGPGVSEDQREQVFEPLDRGTSRAAAGFGLGLAAVRTLARQNGGDCWLEAGAPGAHFVLTMKAQQADVSAEGHRSPC